MIAVIFIAYQFSLRDDDDNMSSNNPGFLGSYQNNGYYRINPETILGDLDQGKTDVFTPFFGDPDNIKDFYTTVWTQSDYLEIANALSQKVWNEPLDLKDWGVYEVYFQEGCTDNPRGFDTLIISYYKTVKVGLEIEYSTRFIQMQAWQGLVGWGGNETFTDPLLFGWHWIDLTKFKIPAETALQIAEKNGGREARANDANKCMIDVTMFEEDNGVWEVDYFGTDFTLIINPYTGSYKTLSTK